MLAVQGHSLATMDQLPFESFEKFLFIDFPSNNIDLLHKLVYRKKELYLVLFESEIIKPDNWQADNYSFFTKVFGWKPVVDARYHRLMIPQNLEKTSSRLSFSERKLACLIASNKYNGDHRELYSHRRNVIRWFESNAPDDLFLYGKGWNDGEMIRYKSTFQKLICLRSSYIRPYPSYRGPVERKREALKNFRFNFCFENASLINGYITEKIFDTMLAGVVPIYWGAPDVFEFIPREAVISFPDFDSNADLYDFLRKMTESEWARYIRVADCFLSSDKIDQFSPRHFSETIIHEMF